MSAPRLYDREATSRSSTVIAGGHTAHHKVRIERGDRLVSNRELPCVGGCGVQTTRRTSGDQAVCLACQTVTVLHERGVQVDDVVAERYPTNTTGRTR